MIFEVTPSHIEHLSDADLRILVGFLAEQDVVRQGYSAVGITYGGHQNAPDGGIDVRADFARGEINGFVPRPQTGFQVKAENMPANAIGIEMRPNGTLRQSISDLAGKGGAYVIVSSKGSVSDSALAGRRKAMRDALIDCAVEAALHVDFYDRRRIATWVNQHPGLIPWVRSRVDQPLSGWRPYEDWSSSPGPEREGFIADDGLRLRGASVNDEAGLGVGAGVNQLRALLNEPKGTVRLVGLSGVGKTRLVQALFDETFGEGAIDPHIAIYTDLADEPDPVPQELLGRVQNLNQRCVLIIDNCGIELHRKLVARMKGSQAPISLITIEYDISDDEPENTDVFKLEAASAPIIEKIVRRRYPQLSEPEAGTIAAFSEGNFRIALALAETAQAGESLANLKDSELFKRLFRQRNDDNPALLRAAVACSLVYSFDGETLAGTDAELPVLAALAEQTVSQTHAHIAELFRRQLVQKRSKWRAILPHALTHKLAKQALQDIPTSVILAAFDGSAPERLLKSFSRRLGCLHDSPEAQKIVEQWLGEAGWLFEIENLNELGMTLLNNIAPVNPRATLENIERAAMRVEALFGDGHGNHRAFVSLLRALAYEPQFFDRAVTLIAGFTAKGQDSNNTGDAINVFKSLFPIYLSGTKAGPEQRANLILDLANTGVERDTVLALAGLDAMLECSHFRSSYGFEFGTRKRDYGFRPLGSEGVRTWYKTVFELCRKLVSIDHMRSKVRTMVASQFNFLMRRTALIDDLIELADFFASDGGWPEGWVGARGALKSANESDRAEDIGKIGALVDRLKPRSLADRIASYVIPKNWGSLDIVDLDLEDDKKYEAAFDRVKNLCEGIGQELAADLDLLATHLPALAASQSYNAVAVFTAIGEHVVDVMSAWNLVRDAGLAVKGLEGTYNIAGIFLRGAAENRREAVEIILDEALANEALHDSFVYLQANAGLNERGTERILIASKLASVPTYTFGNLAIGRVWEEISDENFERVLLAIADREAGLDVAIDILKTRIYFARSDGSQISDAVKTTARGLLSKLVFDRKLKKEDHGLAEIVSASLVAPDDDPLARVICSQLIGALAAYAIYAGDYHDLVGALAAKFPVAVLDVLVEGAAAHKESSYIFSPSRAGRLDPIGRIEESDLFQWAGQKPNTRYVLLAQVIPLWRRVDGVEQLGTDLDDVTGPVQWTDQAVRLFREAPEPIAVLDAFRQRFSPSSGWVGSLTAVLEGRLLLIECLLDDADPAIAKWATENRTSFIAEIDRTRAWEAGHDRVRDERFEW